MLTSLYIKNFTLIEEMELDIGHSMTVVTGETGAGKSIIIDAIGIALGERAGPQVIRQNAQKADICVRFDISNLANLQTWLAERDFDVNDELLIRRVMTQDGRSRSYINGTPTTLNTIKAISLDLLNIHGQHEFQKLLKPHYQLQQLDELGNHNELIATVEHHYQQWRQTQTQLKHLYELKEQREQKSAWLQQQLDNLQDLQITADKLQEYEQEHQQLAHADSLISGMQQCLNWLNDNDSNAIQLTQQLHDELQNLAHYQPSLQSTIELVQQAQIELSESQEELRDHYQQIKIDPERYQQLDQWLSKVYALAKQFQIDPEQLPHKQAELEQQWQQLQDLDNDIADYEHQLQEHSASYYDKAQQLSQARRQTADYLSEQVTHHLQAMNILGEFSIEISTDTEQQPQANGLDQVRYLIATNPGQPPQPLAKIASGGELSRLSLAIQVVTAQDSQTPTLIFDEVDVGIGGATADIVGQLLQKLGHNAQIICITHLAQVAAKGKHHLKVTKTQDQDQPTAHINHLGEQERIEEIARMSGGETITQTTWEHAKTLLYL